MQPTPQDEMRAGMSYFHETIWKGVPKFLRRVDTALKNIGVNERVPYNAPLIQFSSWMGGDRDGEWHLEICMTMCIACVSHMACAKLSCVHCFSPLFIFINSFYGFILILLTPNAGNPRVTPEVTRDVCLLARMMAANLYCAQIEDLMFEVAITSVICVYFIHLGQFNLINL